MPVAQVGSGAVGSGGSGAESTTKNFLTQQSVVTFGKKGEKGKAGQSAAMGKSNDEISATASILGECHSLHC
jgi:hypothetical protein